MQACGDGSFGIVCALVLPNINRRGMFQEKQGACCLPASAVSAVLGLWVTLAWCEHVLKGGWQHLQLITSHVLGSATAWWLYDDA
jgi:hypothetical protein